MALVDQMTHMIARMLLEPAANRPPERLIALLESEGETVAAGWRSAPQNSRNHSIQTHIIGIERWCQSRMRTVTGTPLIMDDYDPYRPPKDTAWEALVPLFEATRAETIALIRTLPAEKLAERVMHNQYGSLTLRAWAFYASKHGIFESRKRR